MVQGTAFRLPAVIRNAKLGTKLLLMMTIVGLVGCIGIFVVLNNIITPSFERLENQAVSAHIQRTKAVMEEYASKVGIAVKDYGVWDDSYKFMEKRNEVFVAQVFHVLAFTNLDINGMAYVGFDHRIHESLWVDLEKQAVDPVLGEGFNQLIRSRRVMNLARDTEDAHFYTRIGDKILAVGIAKVYRSDGSGTPRGFVVMARQLNSQQLSHLLQLDAKLNIDDKPSPAMVTEFPDHLAIAIDIDGIDKSRIATAEFSVNRDLTKVGGRTLIIAVIGSVLVLLVALVMLRRLIDKLAISPLKRVERHMQDVSTTGSPTPLVEQQRRDEIGSLVVSFNTMLAQLKDLREQVEVQSFKLGRSETAVGVMHNVRNGLNPISVIISQGIAEPMVIGQKDVARALSEIANGEAPEARRLKLVAFLSAAIEMQKSQIEKHRGELVTAKHCLSNVIEIIGEQQENAHAKVELEPCDLREVIEHNAALARYSSQGLIELDMFEGEAMVQANRILLSQIIGNLFGNAVEAIGASGVNPGRIAVTIASEVISGRRAIQLQIIDNGEGFAPEDGRMLFQRGYSTRKQKSGGLGLHWCANSINSMHGTLLLTSTGPGMGATATITLLAAEADQGTADDDAGINHPPIAA